MSFAAGYLLTWAGTAPDAWSVTGVWLNLTAVVVLVVALMGVHDTLRRTGTPLATLATVLSMVGFALLVGFFTLRLTLAYGHITPEVTEAPSSRGSAPSPTAYSWSASPCWPPLSTAAAAWGAWPAPASP